MSDKPEIELTLDRIEQLLFTGIQAREREIEREFLTPLRKDLDEVLAQITDRLGLERGAIGKEYQIDFETWGLIPTPKQEDVETEVPASVRMPKRRRN